MLISNSLRLDTRDAIASLKALDVQADLTDRKLSSIGGHTSSQVDSLSSSFKRLDSGLLVSGQHLDDTAKKTETLGKETDTLGAKTEKLGAKTKTETANMSASWSALSSKTKQDFASLGQIITDLGAQRKAATNEMDKALLDQKLAVAKNELRNLARDNAWGQLKNDAESVGYAFEKAGRSIGGGGGGGPGGGRGGVFGMGGFMGGVTQVIRNIPVMGGLLVAALPAVVQLTGALTALAGSLGAAGIGAAALGAGALGAGAVGGISTLIEGKQVLSGIQQTTKAYDAYTKTVQLAGAGSPTAKSAQQRLQFTAGQTGVSVQEVQSLKDFEDSFKKQMAPGRQALTGALFSGIGDLNQVSKPLTGMMNANVAAVADALKGAFTTLTSPPVLHALDSLSGTFQQIAGPAVNTGVNLLRSFLNVAVAAEPNVVHLFKSMEDWSGGLQRTTSDTDRMSRSINGMVSQTASWGGLLKSTGILLKDIFTSGAPSGQSMVQSLTNTFNRWDQWVKTHPVEMKQFFQDAVRDAGKLAGAFASVVKILWDFGKALTPIFSTLSSIVSLLSQSGLLGPLLGSGAAGFLLRGGAAGKLVSPISYLLNPAGGLAGTAGVAAARRWGGAGGLGGAGAGAAAARGGTSVTTTAAEALGAYGLGTRSAGALSALANLGPVLSGAASAAGKFLLPLAVIQGVFGLLTSKGSFADRAAQTAHAMSFGILPGPEPNYKAAAAGHEASAYALGQQFAGTQDPLSVLQRYQGLNQLSSVLGATQGVRSGTNVSGTPGYAPWMGNQAMLAGMLGKGWADGPDSGVKAIQRYQAALAATVQKAVPALVKQLGGEFKFYSEPAMFKQLNTWIQGLPPEAQLAGAKSMETLALSLEKQGKLPKGAAKQLIADINREFPQLSKDFIKAGTNSVGALAQTIRNDHRRAQVAKDIKSAVNPFEQLSALRGVKVSADNVGNVWSDAMAGLTRLMHTGPKAQRDAAKAAYDQLAKDSGAVASITQTNFQNMTKASGGFFGDLTKTIFTETNKQITNVGNLQTAVGGGLGHIMGSVQQVVKSLGGNVSVQIQSVTQGLTQGVLGLPGASTSTRPGHHAKGGRLPGIPSGDHLPLYGRGGQLLGIADGGELVVNRHTEARIARKYGVSLAAEVAREDRPHAAPPRYATGGRVVTASWFDDPTSASGKVHVPGWAELSDPPGALNWAALGHVFGRGEFPMGTMISVNYGGNTINIPKTDRGAGGTGLGGKIRAVDLTKEAKDMLPGFPGLANVTVGVGGSLGAMGGGASVPTIKATVKGAPGAWLDIASLTMQQATQAANKKIAASVPATGAGFGGAAVGSPGGPTGVGSYMGVQMANWVIESLRYAAAHGSGNPQPTSGYRPGFDPHTVSGHSEHSGTQYPHGAVDFGGYNTGLGSKMAVVNATRGFKWPLLAPIGFHDDGHASGTGHSLGGRLPGFAGWYAKGASGWVDRPTVIGVGEGGREHIQITPDRSPGTASASGHGVVIHNLVVENHRKGDIQRMILEELAEVERQMASVHTADPADLMT